MKGIQCCPAGVEVLFFLFLGAVFPLSGVSIILAVQYDARALWLPSPLLGQLMIHCKVSDNLKLKELFD